MWLLRLLSRFVSGHPIIARGICTCKLREDVVDPSSGEALHLAFRVKSGRVRALLQGACPLGASPPGDYTNASVGAPRIIFPAQRFCFVLVSLLWRGFPLKRCARRELPSCACEIGSSARWRTCTTTLTFIIVRVRSLKVDHVHVAGSPGIHSRVRATQSVFIGSGRNYSFNKIFVHILFVCIRHRNIRR